MTYKRQCYCLGQPLTAPLPNYYDIMYIEQPIQICMCTQTKENPFNLFPSLLFLQLPLPPILPLLRIRHCHFSCGKVRNANDNLFSFPLPPYPPPLNLRYLRFPFPSFILIHISFVLRTR